MNRTEPLTLLIAALGGQGGGVLADWIVRAARTDGWIAQATSTPGVSQRTGATTYYVEIAAPPAATSAVLEPAAAAAARIPANPPACVMGLAPVPGRVDVLVCAELLEAARMLERGMSSPSRTTIVASTHRVLTTLEKMGGEQACFDSTAIIDAAIALSRRAVLLDLEALRARHGSAIGAVLFGALVGSGALPIGRAACEDAIRASGKGIDASLAGFDAALMVAQSSSAGSGGAGIAGGRRDGEPAATGSAVPAARAEVVAGGRSLPPLPAALAQRISKLPERVRGIAQAGSLALVEYQDARYAARYLDRVERVAALEAAARADGAQGGVAREAARHLALWMRYDDLIRVAALKSRASRFAAIRGDVDAADEAIVRVYDFFAPSAQELAAILPRRVGAWLERRAIAAGSPAGSAGAGARRIRPPRRLRLQSTSITGVLALRIAAALRPLRPHSLRFAREQQAIDDWLAALHQALSSGSEARRAAAIDLARLPRLVRGYGDTHARGRAAFDRILAEYRQRCVADPERADADLRSGVTAALSGPGCAVAAPVAAAAGRPAAASSPA
ncbi:MAG TPA: indolepyruvate oxidoreductase subunit beta family protein [Casimicrobiaceae bacterium]|nr:indolepyruvate oxidoreductase subunit beta family protein [Casimicrobiaceae bacterium]